MNPSDLHPPPDAQDDAPARAPTRTEATIRHSLPAVHALAIGGTAVGTGLNTHARFGARVAQMLARSLMPVTALSPHIGYDRAAAIARHAHRHGTSLREAALASGEVSAADFDRWVQPTAMTSPGAG